jgi:hypothetical protein
LDPNKYSLLPRHKAEVRDLLLSTHCRPSSFPKPDIQREGEGRRAFAQESSPNKIDT